MKRLPRQLPVRQQGSVLAVVLVFLVFVAIFSVMAMQSATLESRMVATATFQEEALANAELGLKLGEQAIIAEIDDGDALNINDSDIFYPVEGSGTIPFTVIRSIVSVLWLAALLPPPFWMKAPRRSNR